MVGLRIAGGWVVVLRLMSDARRYPCRTRTRSFTSTQQKILQKGSNVRCSHAGDVQVRSPTLLKGGQGGKSVLRARGCPQPTDPTGRFYCSAGTNSLTFLARRLSRKEVSVKCQRAACEPLQSQSNMGNDSYLVGGSSERKPTPPFAGRNLGAGRHIPVTRGVSCNAQPSKPKLMNITLFVLT